MYQPHFSSLTPCPETVDRHETNSGFLFLWVCPTGLCLYILVSVLWKVFCFILFGGMCVFFVVWLFDFCFFSLCFLKREKGGIKVGRWGREVERM